MKHLIKYKEFKVLNESLATAKAKYLDKSLIDPDFFSILVNADPTPTKKYLEVICRFFLNNQNSLNPMTFVIKDLISTYHQLVSKNLIKEKDINQFKTYEEFRTFVEKNKELKSKSEADAITKKGAEKVYEDEHWLILFIKSKEASCLYGKDTEWCITMVDRDYWENYSGNSVFYFVIDKTKEHRDTWQRIAVRVYEDDTLEFWDTTDNQDNNKHSYSLQDFYIIIGRGFTDFPKELISYFKFKPTPVYKLLNTMESLSQEKLLEFLKSGEVSKMEIINTNIFTLACKNGYFDIIKYCVENKAYNPLDFSYNLDVLCRNNKIKIVKYLVKEFPLLKDVKTTLLEMIASLGHVELLKFFVENEDFSGIKSRKLYRIFDTASLSSSGIPAMKYIDSFVKKNNLDVPLENVYYESMIRAIHTGSLDIIKYLIDRLNGESLSSYGWAESDLKKLIDIATMEKDEDIINYLKTLKL